MQINDPAVVAEVEAVSDAYERALIDNDVDALTDFFWDSPHALRFGVTEELYGAQAIGEFRKNRKALFLDRKTVRREVVTLGADLAMVTIEFEIVVFGNPRHGRQSQVWARMPQIGWRVVSAHVSHRVTPQTAAAFNTDDAGPYAAAAAALLDVPIDPAHRQGVAFNLGIMARIAGPLMAIDLPESVEPAPRFIP